LVETLNNDDDNDDDDDIKGLLIYEFEDDTRVNDMSFNIRTLSYRHLINGAYLVVKQIFNAKNDLVNVITRWFIAFSLEYQV